MPNLYFSSRFESLRRTNWAAFVNRQTPAFQPFLERAFHLEDAFELVLNVQKFVFGKFFPTAAGP